MKKLHAFLKPLPKTKNEEKMKKAEDARRQEDSSRGVVILYTIIHGDLFANSLVLALFSKFEIFKTFFFNNKISNPLILSSCYKEMRCEE